MTSKKKALPSYQFDGVVGDFIDCTSRQKDKSVTEVALATLSSPPSHIQARRWFNPDELKRLAKSIKEHGILNPLLVRPLEDGRYELVAGERRYRAAKEAGLEQVPVVIRQLTDNEAAEVSLLENLQREDLNPIEETEGILELLSVRLNQPRDRVVMLLNQVGHPERQPGDNVIPNQEFRVVQEVFTTIGRLTPESFRTNRLPLLKLPETILNALRQGQIEYTKARAIAQVKDTKQQKKLLQGAIKEGLSLSKIKERIKALKSSARSDKGEDEQTTPSLQDRFNKASTKLKKSKVWNNPKKKKRLQRLLGELETLLAEEEG